MFTEPLERRTLLDGNILFIRGAERSGGFIEATNDFQRTEQLADITNDSTAPGNHGWGQLADDLESRGYTLTQWIEPLEAGAPSTGPTTGAPLPLNTLNLNQFDAIVFGSNNARYKRVHFDAVERYIRNGGAALFISDGNFGSDWSDAPTSDTQFLRRFGMAVNQDAGTYALSRTQDFAVAHHPIFNNVTTIDGEGVSPVVVPSTAPAGVSITRLIGAKGTTTNNNGTSSANQFLGTSRAVTSSDATLATALVGRGRVAVHFDRNTFFNQNGAGTDLTRLDNRQYARNLFDWLTDDVVPGVVAQSYSPGSAAVRLTFNDNLGTSLTRDDVLLLDLDTGSYVSRSRVVVRVYHSDTQTTLKVTSRDTLNGRYRLELRERAVTDLAGNTRRSAIRFTFVA